MVPALYLRRPEVSIMFSLFADFCLFIILTSNIYTVGLDSSSILTPNEVVAVE